MPFMYESRERDKRTNILINIIYVMIHSALLTTSTLVHLYRLELVNS
jgi:hypothetical protein